MWDTNIGFKLNKKCDLFQQIQQKKELISGVIIITAEPEQFARVHSLFIENEKKMRRYIQIEVHLNPSRNGCVTIANLFDCLSSAAHQKQKHAMR